MAKNKLNIPSSFVTNGKNHTVDAESSLKSSCSLSRHRQCYNITIDLSHNACYEPVVFSRRLAVRKAQGALGTNAFPVCGCYQQLIFSESLHKKTNAYSSTNSSTFFLFLDSLDVQSKLNAPFI